MIRRVLRTLTAFLTCAACGCIWEPSHRVMALERSAHNFLNSDLAPAQQNMQMDCILDRDADGVGEYGSLAEILERGNPPGGRGLATMIRSFRADLGEGRSSEYYLFKVFVPKEPDLAEYLWCGAAWPLKYGRDGVRRSFLIVRSSRIGMLRLNRRGRCDRRRFSGWGKGPRLDDIFEGEPFVSGVRKDVWETTL
jgi:hypothetical protein